MSETDTNSSQPPPQIRPIQDPDLRSLLQSIGDETLKRMYKVRVGVINSFDASKQTAQVSIAQQAAVYNAPQTVNGQLSFDALIWDYPPVVDCPVVVMGGAAGVLTIPIRAGDTCLVLFSDRDIDLWYEGGGVPVPPNSGRVHSLSDGFALVGVRHSGNPVGSYSTTATELRSLDGGSKLSLDAKVGISNLDTSLKTVFDQLITALTSWVDTHGDTPNPATIAALNAVKALADSLLK